MTKNLINLSRETSIPQTGIFVILALSVFSVYATIGDTAIETKSWVLTYMTATLFGANALYRGFIETGPELRQREAYSFHKL